MTFPTLQNLINPDGRFEMDWTPSEISGSEVVFYLDPNMPAGYAGKENGSQQFPFTTFAAAWDKIDELKNNLGVGVRIKLVINADPGQVIGYPGGISINAGETIIFESASPCADPPIIEFFLDGVDGIDVLEDGVFIVDGIDLRKVGVGTTLAVVSATCVVKNSSLIHTNPAENVLDINDGGVGASPVSFHFKGGPFSRDIGQDGIVNIDLAESESEVVFEDARISVSTEPAPGTKLIGTAAGEAPRVIFINTDWGYDTAAGNNVIWLFSIHAGDAVPGVVILSGIQKSFTSDGLAFSAPANDLAGAVVGPVFFDSEDGQKEEVTQPLDGGAIELIGVTAPDEVVYLHSITAFTDTAGAAVTTDVRLAFADGSAAVATTAGPGVWGALEARSNKAGSITQAVDLFFPGTSPADSFATELLAAGGAGEVLRWVLGTKLFKVVSV